MKVENIALLRKAIEWAEEQQDSGTNLWDQNIWLSKRDCGTSYCIAGYMGQLMEPAFRDDDLAEEKNLQNPMGLMGVVHVSEYVRNRLGLTVNQAAVLFQATNTIDNLKDIFETVTNEKF